MDKPNKPRRTQSLPLRLHPVERRQLEDYCAINCCCLSEVIRHALREFLRSHGLWPPPSQGPKVWEK